MQKSIKIFLRTLILACVLILLVNHDAAGQHSYFLRANRSGLLNCPELSYGAGLGVRSVPLSKYYINISNYTAYEFNRNIMAGVCYGMQFHNGGTFIPLGIDARISRPGDDIAVVFSMSSGLALSPVNPINKSKIYINPSMGIRYPISNSEALFFSVGLRINGRGDKDRSSYISLKTGVELKGRPYSRGNAKNRN